jgi:hypothetical protein
MPETSTPTNGHASTPDQVRRIFTATLILGVPGSGKTSLLASFAEYLWETYHKVLLLYSWDGGAIPTALQKLMRQGLIRFWRARTRSAEMLGIETLYLATKGYWPRTINVETGETSPAVDLVPPVTVQYHVSCSKTGAPLGTLPTRASVGPMFCAACKNLHPLGELTVVEDAHRTRGFELVGGVAFDGLTSMTGVVMEHMDHARGQGHIGGEKPAFGGVVVSGTIKLGGNNRADVGFGQTRGQQFVNNALSIPFLVEGPVFTALSMEATDEGGLPIVGAKLPGRAATDEASAWFGNVFEMGKTNDDAGNEHFTLFLRPFTDPQNRRHLLKTSASPLGLPDKLVDPISQPWAQANLGHVFHLLDEDLKLALAEEVPGAPGLAGTPTDYGEAGFSVSSAPAAPSGGELPPLLPAVAATPVAATPTTVGPRTPPVAAMPGVVPTVTARKRPRAQPASAPVPVAVATPIEPAVATLAEPVAEPVPRAAGGPPPPPGMKPPQRAPNAP